jgi:serine/threonine protein kinase
VSDLIGKIICGYRIVSQIGEGGMGKVYLGESAFLTEYKQQVAIKTLTSRGASERQAAIMRDLFIREANIQVQLKHPHIVSVIQFAVEGDEHFLILEYLPGYPFQGRRMSNVADVIARELGPIPASLAFEWFSQTLDAMSYAHDFRYRWQGEERVGIVHRDIKPANLLLVDPKTIKVSDFGIVKVHQRGVAITRNLTPGTSAYMSPEAILGPKQYGLQELDGRSDIYSLGISLFEMLTGKLPFKPDKGVSADSSLRRKQVGETPPAPSTILPDLSREIDAVVLRALEKHPDSRYQSAAEFKRAIQELERKRLTVVIAADPTVDSAYETRPFEGMDGTEVLQVKATSVRAGVAATEVMPDVFLTTPIASAPSTPVEQPLTRPPSGSRLYLWLVGVIAVVLLGAIAAIPLVNWLFAKKPPPVPVTTPVATATATPVAIPEGMVAIPPGSYLMGRDLTEEEKKFEVVEGNRPTKVFSYDYPAHEVQVKAFYIDRTEVSNREYSRFVNATNHAPPQNWPGNDPPQNAENIPVTYVNFLDATDFCAWRGRERKDGVTYRLPSEEEWEFAARGRDAGKPGRLRLYPWGDDWAEGHANTRESKLGYPQIVTANPAGASPFGVLNMAGNVYEWTGTDFSHYPGSDQKTPREAGYKGVYQVVRGGSFDYVKEYAMTTTRVWARPTDKGPRLGFRCAADAK